MAKLTAWMVTIIGVILLLPLIGIYLDDLIFFGIADWLITLAVLVIGISKLMRNYQSRRR